VLRPLQAVFDPQDYPDLMVGLGAPDDAAVWRLDEARALVITTDFFTPVVDDAYDYGSIAAANALSDLYAMGARPILALNIACLPPSLPPEQMGEITRGAADKVREAGAVIAGGHSVQDDEPKVGLVAVGLADPEKLISKGGAIPGDLLLLTKPIGTGVTATALKADKASMEHVAHMTAWMKELNRGASELAVSVGVRGGTDVTGYSLLGHAVEMAQASGARLHFFTGCVPVLAGARGYADQHFVPGGSYDNRLYYGPKVTFSADSDEMTQTLLFDSQTSGGLLLAIDGERCASFMSQAGAQGVSAWVVGRVEAGQGIQVSNGTLPDGPAAVVEERWNGTYSLLSD
jgi:selenide,water dikinase